GGGLRQALGGSGGGLAAGRKALLFSATMPGEIAELARSMLRNPARVEVVPAATTADRLEQRIIHVHGAGKPALLAEILRAEPIERALVFTRTKHHAEQGLLSLANS